MREIKKESIIYKGAESLYLVGVALYTLYFMYYVACFWKIKDLPENTIPAQRIFYIAMVVLILKIVLTIWQYNIFEIIFGLIATIILYFCWKTSGTIDFAINFVLLFAIKNVDLKKVMKVIFIVGMVMFVYGFTYIFLTNPAGISVTRDFGRGAVETRYQFFTWHPNILHLVVASFVLVFFYVYYESCKWWLYVIAFFANYELYLLTKSRTGYIVASVGIILFFFLKYLKKFFQYKITLLIFEIANICMIFGSFYFGFIAKYESKWYQLINSKLTGRLDVFRTFVNESGYHLFGSSLGNRLDGFGLFVKKVPGSVPELGFPRMILEYGPLISIGVILIILIAIWAMDQTGKYDGMVLLTACMLSFTVDALYPAAWNPMPFVLGYGIFQCSKLERFQKRKKHEREEIL